uniref:IML15 n=2 Tax=Mythimna separata TaxID=271217 RepID=A0A8F3HKI1_MYTSE|nr:IML15 [Mythimna separata]
MFSNKILVVFIVYFALNLSHGQKDVKFFRNDYVYLDATESFYKINSLIKNFFDAKRACALEGASLWYPENQEEADAVISHWNSTQPTWWAVTIGMSDLIVKGLFETIDGKRVADVYHNWNLGEPNDSGNEDCVIIFSSGKMNDVACDRKFPYFCKKTLQSLEWNQACNMPDLDYSLNEKSGKCYKVHSVPLNWTDAYNVCSSEQSYLSVANSWLEINDLVKLTETKLKDWNGGSYLRGIYHLGFHSRFNEGWQTVQGTPVNGSIALFGSRLNEGSHDQCGAMFYTGRLTQVDCGLKCSFICEHEVSSKTENEENFQ